MAQGKVSGFQEVAIMFIHLGICPSLIRCAVVGYGQAWGQAENTQYPSM